MTNGQWLEILDRIRRQSEACLLPNPQIPDDLFPFRGILKITTSMSWRLYLTPCLLKSWRREGEICLGIVLTPEGSTATFIDEGAPSSAEHTTDLPNWPGVGELRAALGAGAERLMGLEILAAAPSVRSKPGGRFLTRTRLEVSAHELLEIQAALDARRHHGDSGTDGR